MELDKHFSRYDDAIQHFLKPKQILHRLLRKINYRNLETIYMQNLYMESIFKKYTKNKYSKIRYTSIK